MRRENKINMAIFLILLFSFSFLAPSIVIGSLPVEKTLTGCVIGGRFFSVYNDSQTNRPVKAYPIRIEKNINLPAYEGKTISMKGSLLPGDRFFIREGDVPVVVNETCAADYLKVIKKEHILEYRVAGYTEAKKKNFEEALKLLNWALDMDKTSCDSYVSRAQIYYPQGDFASGGADIKTVRDGLCVVEPQGLNYLVLEEIGTTLEGYGKSAEALELYKMGLNSCQSNMCRETMNKHIRKLNER